MAYPMGESKFPPLRVNFDRRLKLEFHVSDISSDGGLLPYRELDDALGLTEVGGEVLSDIVFHGTRSEAKSCHRQGTTSCCAS